MWSFWSFLKCLLTSFILLIERNMSSSHLEQTRVTVRFLLEDVLPRTHLSKYAVQLYYQDFFSMHSDSTVS